MLSKPDELSLLHGMRKEQAENSWVCLKRACPARNQDLTTLSYLPQSALVGLMALDRIIPKEWFVLCKVNIWDPAETRELHIISCKNIEQFFPPNCIMEEKTDRDWEWAIFQIVSWSRWLNSFFLKNRENHCSFLCMCASQACVQPSNNMHYSNEIQMIYCQVESIFFPL